MLLAIEFCSCHRDSLSFLRPTFSYDSYVYNYLTLNIHLITYSIFERRSLYAIRLVSFSCVLTVKHVPMLARLTRLSLAEIIATLLLKVVCPNCVSVRTRMFSVRWSAHSPRFVVVYNVIYTKLSYRKRETIV